MRQNTLSKQTITKDSRANRSLLLRVVFLLCLCGVGLFCPLIWKLYSLQITQHEHFKEQAAQTQTKSDRSHVVL